MSILQPFPTHSSLNPTWFSRKYLQLERVMKQSWYTGVNNKLSRESFLVMCWPETDTFDNNNVILWDRERGADSRKMWDTVAVSVLHRPQCITKYPTHHNIEASEGIIHEATCQVMISTQQHRLYISLPRNLIFYNFLTMMGKLRLFAVGVAQTAWRWYSGERWRRVWWHWLAPSQTSYGASVVVKRKWI